MIDYSKFIYVNCHQAVLDGRKYNVEMVTKRVLELVEMRRPELVKCAKVWLDSRYQLPFTLNMLLHALQSKLN